MHRIHQVIERVAPWHLPIGVTQELGIIRRGELLRRLEIRRIFVQRIAEPHENGAGDLA